MRLIDFVSFVKRGKNRKKVFLALDKALMPSELMLKIYGRSSSTYFNLVSRALSELKSKKLVDVINSRQKTGRIYRKTSLGKQVEEKI